MAASNSVEDVRIIVEILKAAPHGHIIVFEQMSKAVGYNILRRRHIIYRALKQMEEEVGGAFASIRGVGYRRLRSDELPTVGATARFRVRGIAARTVRTLQAGMKGANDMTPETHRRLSAELSIAGLLEMAAQDSSLPDITGSTPRVLSVGEMSKAFLKKAGAIK